MLGAIDIILTLLYMITLFHTIFWLITMFDMKEDKQKKIKVWPVVTVLVPAYNEEKSIKRTMESVLNLNYPKQKLQLIVVNDGSTDNTGKIAKQIKTRFKDRDIVIINQKNQGKYVCLNKGLEIVKGEYYACLDADSFIEKDGLRKMLPYFAKAKVGAVLPLMKVQKPKNLLQKIQWYEYVINMFYKRIMSLLDCIHVAPGPFSLYRTSIIKKLGGFKKAHKTEDLEMALRLQKNQYKIIQLTNAIVYTIAPSKLKALYKQRNRWNKGSVLNSWDYRKLMFNRKYGDFGMLQMPIVLSAGFIAMTLICMILYFSIVKPSFKFLQYMFVSGFDIQSYFSNMFSNFHILDIDFYKIIIIVVMLTISVIVLFYSHKFAKESIKKHGILPLVAFIFFYYLLLGFIWLGITKDLIVRRDVRWK